MTDGPDNDRPDMYRAIDELQLRSREQIDSTLPVDPVAEFDDGPVPSEPGKGSLMADLDLPLPEPDPEASEPELLDFEINLSDVEDDL